MHNKRIGRDDLLKIEVFRLENLVLITEADAFFSGLVPLRRRHGALTQALAAIAVVPVDVIAHPVVVASRPAVAEATIRRARMIAASVIMTVATVTALEARTIVTAK